MNREARISNYILAVFSIFSLILMSLPLSSPVRTVKAALSYAFVPAAFYGSRGTARLASVPANVRNLISAEVSNQALLEEMRRLPLIKAEAESLRRENERLTAALGLRPFEGRGGIWARVMERNPLNWYRGFMVDAGSDRGVTLNAPVLGARGESLVALGRVVEVSPRHAKVLLLSDELSSAAAYLSTGTAEGQVVEGLIEGQGRGRLLMNYINSEAELSEGSLVLTSRTSAIFPPDILIGTAVKIRPRDPFLMSLSVEVRSAADSASFSEVCILLPPAERAAGPTP